MEDNETTQKENLSNNFNPQSPKNIGNQNTNSQQIGNPSNLNATEQNSSPSKKKLYILVGVVSLLILSGIAGAMFYMKNTQLQKIQAKVDEQIQEIKKLEKTYSNIKVLIKEQDDEEKKAEDSQSASLLYYQDAVSEPISDTETDVLGSTEESLKIDVNRQLSKEFKAGRKYLKNISNLDKEISSAYNKNPLLKPFLPNPESQIKTTEEMVKKSDPLLRYMDDANSLDIDAKTLGYQIGIAIEEAIVAYADRASLNKFDDKLNELDDLYEKAKAINTDGLSDELVKDHEESLASYEEDTKVFKDIQVALEQKSSTKLERALQSLIYQSASQNTKNNIDELSFWEDYEIVNLPSEVRSSWESFVKANF